MLLIIVLMVMFISAALLMALLSGFLPFVQNYGNTAQYTTAYYGALSAIERGVLAANYAGPGFDGESGRKDGVHSGATSDQKLENFYTYGDPEKNMLKRSVISRTQSIPTAGDGNVDPDFWASDDQNARNYNALHYNQTEIIPLGVVDPIAPEAYYKKKDRHTFFNQENPINIHFRLNPLLRKRFEGTTATFAASAMLNEAAPDPNALGRNNDLPMVSWIINGEYPQSPDAQQYALIGRSYGSFETGKIPAQDTLIRASKINQSNELQQGQQEPMTMTFGGDSKIFPTHQNAVTETLLNVISNHEQDLINEAAYTKIFKAARDTKLTFNLSNLLYTQGANFYPFLEYKIWSDTPLADRFFTIKGEGKVNDYHIRMQVQKPTLPQPALGSFTIIF